MKRLNRKKRTMSTSNTIEAYIFLIPFLIGAVAFLIYPLFTTVKLSFGELSGGSQFVLKWLDTEFFKHYKKALLIDTTFVPVLLKEVKVMLIRTPLIMVVSLILAICISRKIKFRGFFRLVFSCHFFWEPVMYYSKS